MQHRFFGLKDDKTVPKSNKFATKNFRVANRWSFLLEKIPFTSRLICHSINSHQLGNRVWSFQWLRVCKRDCLCQRKNTSNAKAHKKKGTQLRRRAKKVASLKTRLDWKGVAR